MTVDEPFFRGSQVYEAVARLRLGEDLLYVVRVGMEASKRLMILTASGEPAWPHEPFASLSDVAWSLRAHQRHAAVVEEVGSNPGPARTLTRLLAERT
jgi:hypothetical protein